MPAWNGLHFAAESQLEIEGDEGVEKIQAPWTSSILGSTTDEEADEICQKINVPELLQTLETCHQTSDDTQSEVQVRPVVKRKPLKIFKAPKSQKKVPAILPRKVKVCEKKRAVPAAKIVIIVSDEKPADTAAPKLYSCKICGKEYGKSSQLGGHFSKAHPGQSEDFNKKMKTRLRREAHRKLYHICRKMLEELKPSFEMQKHRSILCKFMQEVQKEMKINPDLSDSEAAQIIGNKKQW